MNAKAHPTPESSREVLAERSTSVVVISDATPIHYLILIDEIDLLQRLYGRVVIPSGVIEELSVAKTPALVRRWIAALPSWAEVAVVPVDQTLPFAGLGRGESEAIWLAAKSIGSILLIDDFSARSAATSAGIQTVPTIRILSTAAALSLVKFDDALARLQRTNFRVSQRVINSILKSQPIE